ncbi:hypothetical protein [Agromyces sp. Marseille-P2726]|uniref:hypothetical protein n=1 Tax=Agromyces sp. Marseille-P2726 TaxID=2709132 RepID=UPI00156F8F8B|nr:hypothetical protein [Agromyces sp. Marseille-P2726]
MNDIESRVRAWARGLYPTEAGVELLIRQGKAIREGAPWLAPHGDLVAIDVDRLLAAAGAWSGGEQRVVAIAASLLGGPAVDLSEVIPGLDRDNAALVLAAIAHANGSREHSGVRFSDGGVPVGFFQEAALFPWPAVAQQT